MSNKVRINKQLIAAIEKHRPIKGDRFLRDIALKGFGIRLTPTNGSYIVERRLGAGGKAKRIVIGNVATLDLDEAKLRAKELLLELEKGITLQPAPAAPKLDRPPTFAEAIDLYLSQRPMRESSREQYRVDLNYNLPDLLPMPISAISESIVIREFQRISKRAPVQAIKVAKMAHGVMSFASAHPLCRYPDGSRMLLVSPWRILSELKMIQKPKPRTDYISEAEMSTFYRLLQREPNLVSRNLILFLLLTGCRFNEARQLRWSEVNMLAGRIVLPAERVKTDAERQLPITSELSEILQQQGRARTEIDEFVFPSMTHSSFISDMTVRQAFYRIRKQMNRPDLKLHGLRRTYITLTSHAEVMSEWQQKALVGHAGDITSAYRQITLEQLKAPAQRATSRLMRLLTAADKTAADSIDAKVSI